MIVRGTTSKIANQGLFAIPESVSEWKQLLRDHSSAPGVGLYILDADFRCVAINQTLAQINGIPEEAHLGRTIRELLGDFAEVLEPYLERVKETGLAVLNREISVMLPTRNEPGHWIEHYLPIKDQNGKVTHIGSVVLEITAQKQVEESLRGVSENLKDQKKRALVMTEVGRLLEAKWNARQIFPRVSAHLRRVLRQEYAALSLLDEKSGQLVRQSIDFPLRKASRAGNVSAPKDPSSKALQERTPLILDKKDLQGFQTDITDHLLTEGLQSLCCVPLIRPKGPLGVLVLGSTRVDAFKSDDLALLNQVAAQLAIAFENEATAHDLERLRSQLAQEKEYLEGGAHSSGSFWRNHWEQSGSSKGPQPGRHRC